MLPAYVFSAPALEPAISLRSPFFLLQNGIRNLDQSPRCACSGQSQLSVFSYKKCLKLHCCFTSGNTTSTCKLPPLYIQLMTYKRLMKMCPCTVQYLKNQNSYMMPFIPLILKNQTPLLCVKQR